MAAETAAELGEGQLEVASGLIETVDNIERVLEAEKVDLETAKSGSLPEDAEPCTSVSSTLQGTA